MLRKLGFLGAAAGLALAAASPAPALTKLVTFHFIEVTTSFQFVDLGTPGLSPGDQAIFTSKFFRRGSTKPAGRAEVVSTVLAATPGAELPTIVLTNGTAFFAGGEIVAAGVVRVPVGVGKGFTIPIVGGTGVYANARGDIQIKNLNKEGTKSLDTIRLLP